MDLQSLTLELPALVEQLCELPAEDVLKSNHFRDLSRIRDRAEILQAVSNAARHTIRPLHLLHTLLTKLPGPWPPTSLIRCYSRLTKFLPEEVKTDRKNEAWRMNIETSQIVQSSYFSFAEFLIDSRRPALRAKDDFITHKGLRDFVKEFRLPIQPAHGKPIVAIALPNGVLLAAICFAVTTYYTAAPVNPSAGPEQFKADVVQCGAQFILTSAEDYKRLELSAPGVAMDNIKTFIVEWEGKDDIRLRNDDEGPVILNCPRPTPNRGDDISLILFTSGTSGMKKVVPTTLHSIVAGLIFVMDSWGLGPEDTCVNMMPLYHM